MMSTRLSSFHSIICLFLLPHLFRLCDYDSSKDIAFHLSTDWEAAAFYVDVGSSFGRTLRNVLFVIGGLGLEVLNALSKLHALDTSTKTGADLA